MPRVLLLGSLTTVPKGRFVLPRDRFYGAAYFGERGYDVVAADPRLYSRWRGRLVRRTHRTHLPILGDVPSMALSARLLRGVDLIYNHADIDPILPLIALRAARLLRVPIVTLMHSPPFSRGRVWPRSIWHLAFQGSDALPTFSGAVADEIRKLPRHAGKVAVLPLGPDLDAYPAAEYPGEGILCCGRSNRDRSTFARAATLARVDAEIVTSFDLEGAELDGYSPNVKVTIPPRRDLSLAAIHARVAACRALAIPLVDSRIMAGGWQLCDALGVGKPIVMTRQSQFGIDIEREGIGFWAEPHDAESWIEPLRYLDDNPDKASAMGRAARRLAEQGYNARVFADGIMDIFDGLLGIDTRDGASPAGGTAPAPV